MPFSWVDDVEGEDEEEGQWENKEDERLLWRGTNTGIYHAKDKPWKAAQRGRLMELAQKPSGSVDILLTDDGSDGQGMRMESVKQSRLNHAMFDIAFAGNPSQCDPETCRELDENFDWRKRMNIRDAGRYKYVLDVSVQRLLFVLAHVFTRWTGTGGRVGLNGS